MMIQVVWLGSQFITTVILARTLDPASFGTYALGWTLVTLLQFLPASGLATAVVRFSATYTATGASALLRGLWRHFMILAIAYGVLTATILALPFLSGWQSPNTLFSPRVLIAISPALLLLPVLAIIGATLRGTQPGVIGQLPESVIRPLVFLALILATTMGYLALPDPITILLLQGLSTLVAVTLGLVFLLRRTQLFLSQSASPRHEVNRWSSAAFQLSVVGALMVINNQMDVLILGWFRSADEVAHYRVAVQSASLVGIALTAANLLLAPRIASLHSRRDFNALQRLLLLSARLTFLPGIVVTVVFLLFGRLFMATVFGPEYAVAYILLIVLSLGQLANVACGSVGTALNMTGHERDALHAVAVAAATNVLFNFLLVPAFGGLGAATATTASMTIWNVAMVMMLARRTRLSSFLIRFPSR